MTLEHRMAQFADVLAQAEQEFGITVGGKLAVENFGSMVQTKVVLQLMPMTNWIEPSNGVVGHTDVIELDEIKEPA